MSPETVFSNTLGDPAVPLAQGKDPVQGVDTSNLLSREQGRRSVKRREPVEERDREKERERERE